MAIEWSEGLSTGIEWQDKQHKELFTRINNLLDAMNVGRGKDEVLRIFKFLDEYFIVHFEVEEQAMHKYNYPETLEHIAEHTGFIDDVGKLRDVASEQGITTGLVIQVHRRVVDWLINHIGEVDQNLAQFIKNSDSVKA